MPVLPRSLKYARPARVKRLANESSEEEAKGAVEGQRTEVLVGLNVEPEVQSIFATLLLEEEVIAVQVDGWFRVCWQRATRAEEERRGESAQVRWRVQVRLQGEVKARMRPTGHVPPVSPTKPVDSHLVRRTERTVPTSETHSFSTPRRG